MKPSDRYLIRQMEKHAKEAKLLDQVREVIKTIPNLRIFKKKYLVIDKKDKK